MTNEMSPRNMARLTGIVYLVLIVSGVFAQGFVAERMIDFRNAGATASNILANQTLYTAGFTVYLIEMTAQIVTAVLFYYLLKPVSRSAALMSTVLLLVGSVIKTMARLFFLAPLWVLNTHALAGYSADQINSLALVLLRINDDGAALACAFFGPSTFLHGWLIMKSTFLPKWLGVLSIVGGIAWTSFYWPQLGRDLFMVSALLGLVGSLATIGWFVFRGLNEERWREEALASASSLYR